MTVWGKESTWGQGNFWGLSAPSNASLFCDLAQDRVLIQMDDTTGNRKFRDLICLLVEDLGRYQDVAEEVEAAFDLATADGVQLDTIGSVVGLPRQGLTDARYRTFLEIQVDLLLAGSRDGGEWTGTHNNILSIVRKFIGASAGTITLTNLPPYAFTLDIPGIVLSEMLILVRFLCQAVYAGVLGSVTFTTANNSLWDSDSVAITGAGDWCSDSVTITPCAEWGLTVAIGAGACP